MNSHKIKTELSFQEDHPFFKGHFAEYPVLPGVYQVQIVLDEIRTHYDEDFDILRIPNIKYINPVLPGEKIAIEVVKASDEKYSFTISSNEGSLIKLFSKGTLIGC